MDEPMAPYPSAPTAAAPASYPLTFTVEYPDRPLDRLSSFFRWLWLIPIGIIAALIGTGNISVEGTNYSWSWAVGGVLFCRSCSSSSVRSTRAGGSTGT